MKSDEVAARTPNAPENSASNFGFRCVEPRRSSSVKVSRKINSNANPSNIFYLGQAFEPASARLEPAPQLFLLFTL